MDPVEPSAADSGPPPGPRATGRGLGAAAAEAGMALGLLLAADLLVMSLLDLAGGGPARGGAASVAWLLAGALRTGLAAAGYAAVTRALGEPAPARCRPPRRPPLGAAGQVLLLAAAATAGSALIGQALELLGAPPQEQPAVLALVAQIRAGGAMAQAVSLWIAAVLLAPAAEEWLFRGLLFRRTRALAGAPWAYALSAATFAVIHGNTSGLPVYGWLGLCFAAALHRTGRLGAAFAVHAINNALVLGLLFAGISP